jgi:hypothetical protein
MADEENRLKTDCGKIIAAASGFLLLFLFSARKAGV